MRARLRAFPTRVRFDDVAEAVAAAGAQVRRLPRVTRHSPENYWVPQGRVLFSLAAPGWAGNTTVIEVGEVVEVSALSDVYFESDYGTRYR